MISSTQFPLEDRPDELVVTQGVIKQAVVSAFVPLLLAPLEHEGPFGEDGGFHLAVRHGHLMGFLVRFQLSFLRHGPTFPPV